MGILLLAVYNLLAPLIAAAYFVFFLLSPRRGLLAKLGSELSERLALFPPDLPGRPVWLHAASLGEVRAVRLLVPLLKERFPGHPVLITSSSSSGRAEALKLTPHARLLPLDSYPLMRRFISSVKPRMLLIAETELWPNLLCAAGRSGVPVALVNARLSARTLSFYRFLSPVTSLLFSNVARICAQSPGDLERYSLLPGTEGKLVLTGNLKHDQVASSPAEPAEIEAFLAKAGWKGMKIFCAGSTHPGEEDAVLDAYLKIRASAPETRLVLAPRHPETVPSSEQKLAQRNLAWRLWSRRSQEGPSPDCMLLDKTGHLTDIYFFSDVIFIGGTLDDTGGHNVLEPSAFSKPVIFGPNIAHTREGAEALLKAKGGFMVKTSAELAGTVSSLLSDPSSRARAGQASKTALASLQGANEATLDALTGF